MNIEEIKEALREADRNGIPIDGPHTIIRFLLAECQKWQELYDYEYRERKKYKADANYFSGEVDRLTAELAEVRTYKQVIDDALVVANIGVASGDARADLHKLLVWEIDVALDPRVSKRAADLLAEKDAEIERLEKVKITLSYAGTDYPFEFADCKIADYGHFDNVYIVTCPEIEEKLKAAESLAASRLADQEAIERHVTKRVAEECAEIAEAMWSDHYWAWPAMQTYADKIRKKYGVSNEK